MIAVAALGLFIAACLLFLLGPPAKRRAVLIGALLGFLVLFFHPWFFGLPGRIAETQFARHVHDGMTRADIIRLAAAYGGTDSNGHALAREEPAYELRSDGALFVSFTDYVTLCISGGKNFSFYFDPSWTMTKWKVENWGNAC